jgi:hypothetical protein
MLAPRGAAGSFVKMRISWPRDSSSGAAEAKQMIEDLGACLPGKSSAP